MLGTDGILLLHSSAAAFAQVNDEAVDGCVLISC
jgi:hypothetical protein